MRCNCCDRMLNDFESTRRLKSTGDFADLCNRCVGDMGGLEFIVRTDLEPYAAVEEAADQILKEASNGETETD